MNTYLHRVASAISLGLPLLALAQQPSDPTDAKASASSLRYQSAFADYKPWRELKTGDWRRINDAVAGASGGHHDHSTATPQAPDPPKASASTPAAQGGKR